MSVEDEIGLKELFVQAFRDFAGAILFGGTRMLFKSNFKTGRFGITELAPLIGEQNPDCVILGVVPRTEELKFSPYGVIISEEPSDDFITILHPNQDICLIVQLSADNPEIWDAEYEECIEITNNLRQFAGWDSLLISYNGGTVTEREILKTAKLGWPVLLINGSGRKTEEYANNIDFLQTYPNVHVAEKNVACLREKLFILGALKKNAFPMVEKDGAKKVVG